ncbi:IS630 family transposase [Candidatus Micrarchaeota archaeon]|nr:IS630 family transposase [Candidatus Micrarchaeota archaeon]
MNKLAEYASLLKEEYEKCRDVKESKRYQALYLVASDYTYKEAAFIVCKNEETVSFWVQKYLEEKSVKDKPKEGRPEIITKEMQKENINLVEENDPTNCKINFTIIDCAYLQDYLLKKYYAEVTTEAIRLILVREGYHYRKSEYDFTKKQNEKRKEYLIQTLSLFSNPDNDLNFLDEARSKLHPKPGYFWTKNPRPIVKTECSHKGVTIKGTVNPITGETILETYDKNDRESHFDFIKKFISIKEILVRNNLAKKVFLFLDNLSVHKVREVLDYASNYPWLKIVFQPTYSPDLNLIEWLWGFLRRKKLNGQSFSDIESMKKKLAEIFKDLDPETIRKTCSIAILQKRALEIGIT